MSDTKVQGKKTYSGASDVAKLTRHLETHSKTRERVLSGTLYTYTVNTEYIKTNNKIFYTTKTKHSMYASDMDQFIRSLKIIGKLSKKSKFIVLGNGKFEHIQTLNNEVIVKETTEIIGIE